MQALAPQGTKLDTSTFRETDRVHNVHYTQQRNLTRFLRSITGFSLDFIGEVKSSVFQIAAIRKRPFRLENWQRDDYEFRNTKRHPKSASQTANCS